MASDLLEKYQKGYERWGSVWDHSGRMLTILDQLCIYIYICMYVCMYVCVIGIYVYNSKYYHETIPKVYFLCWVSNINSMTWVSEWQHSPTSTNTCPTVLIWSSLNLKHPSPCTNPSPPFWTQAVKQPANIATSSAWHQWVTSRPFKALQSTSSASLCTTTGSSKSVSFNFFVAPLGAVGPLRRFRWSTGAPSISGSGAGGAGGASASPSLASLCGSRRRGLMGLQRCASGSKTTEVTRMSGVEGSVMRIRLRLTWKAMEMPSGGKKLPSGKQT